MAPKRARASNAAETKSASSGLFLIKSEPDDFSLDDLANKETECWDGVRNPIARKHLRAMSVGDQVLFYHSSCKDVGVVGVAEVTRDAYPDPSQFDASSKYYDPKSTQEQPRWDSVDVKFVSRLPRTVGLKELKEIAAAPGEGQDVLSDFALLRMSRLSVMPVEQRVWDFILALADQEPPEPKKKKRKSKAKAEDSDGGSDGQ
ncbi:unnamed protein product [Pedinophyceae sp. YPF-701]|nr:unnamed protein product [Pedinophyceae sp. YPF-701]